MRLKFTPTVIGRQMIRLKVAPEVSEQDFTNAVQLADTGNYTVVVANSAGSVISNAAILTVTAIAPTITTQPQSQPVNVGVSVTFSVGVSGTAPFTYQWYRMPARTSTGRSIPARESMAMA